MRRGLLIIGILAVFALIAAPVFAASGTLYQQEGTANDNDPTEVDAAGHGPTGTDSDNWNNWKYQYGSGSWSGVYAGDDGWMTVDETGDATLEVEADIEMYFTESVSKNKIYFHLGNIYEATSADKIAYVQGQYSSNNGQYIGISFDGTSKTENSFQKDSIGYTGVILGGMVSDHDTWRTQNNDMDIEILLSWGAGWQRPVTFGAGSHNTQQNVLWWLVNNGEPGTYSYTWRVRILPEAHQPDGDYYLDPVVVATPVL